LPTIHPESSDPFERHLFERYNRAHIKWPTPDGD
jgi:hypothetical protein